MTLSYSISKSNGAIVGSTVVYTCNQGYEITNGSVIVAIQTFDPSTLSVLYNKDVYPTSSIVWSTTFPFHIFKSHYTTQNTIISFLFSILFYFTDIKFYRYIYVHYYYVFIYYYYYPALGALNISFY